MGSARVGLCSEMMIIMALLSSFHGIIIISSTSLNESENQSCSTSSCGLIQEIRDPFRLETDPDHCGDKRYNLSCENNITVLYLYSGRYHVHSINYNDFTIRLMDSNVQISNCSNKIPLHSLSFFNFTTPGPGDSFTTFRTEFPFYPSLVSRYSPGFRPLETSFSFDKSHPYWSDLHDIYSYGFYDVYMFRQQVIVFLNCRNPVNSPYYIDSTRKGCNRGEGNSYVMVGLSDASQIREFCRIELIVMTSFWQMDYSYMTPDPISSISLREVHDALLYGFELKWVPGQTGSSNSSTENYEPYIPANSGVWQKLQRNPTIILKGFWLFLISDNKIGKYFLARTIIGVVLVAAFLIYKWRRRHLSMYPCIEEFLQTNNNLMPIRYSLFDIKIMTRGFKVKLGEGGFGSVYKGKLRSGNYVAIKMLGKSKNANVQDFINEVATIGRIHHINVVRLIGFCVQGSKRALVYDFMPNGSLDKYIFSPEESTLNSKKMFEISLGVASGMKYLHQGCDTQILHFDIKPHNILLDENFVPKVSDFGLARLCPMGNNSVYLTAIRGTLGYIAPELFYKNIGGVSYKADVYSFGKLLLEMAIRRKNSDKVEENTSETYYPLWIYDQFSQGQYIEMCGDDEEESKLIKKMFIIAIWCIQLKPSDRPSMNKIIEMLEGDVEGLQMPPKPLLYPQQGTSVDLAVNASFSSCSSSTLSEDESTEITPLQNN